MTSQTSKTLCVYCGASSNVSDIYKKATYAFGKMAAEQGWRIVYGGGHVGLMGIVADAAMEAGGEVIGYIPKHLEDIEVGHHQITELHIVSTMHERKEKMAQNADAFVILPGGYGTLEEFFEVLTWKQIGLHDRPIIIYNVDDYWQKLHDLLNFMNGEGFIHSTLLQLYDIFDDLDTVFAKLKETTTHKPAIPMDKI